MEHTPPHAPRPNALHCFEAIAARLTDKTPVLFLDYDGTLVPLARRPDLAVASDSLREVVARLAELMPVAVVSGRGREDVTQMLGVDGIAYAGSHGFDIRDAHGRDLSGDIGAPYVPALHDAAKSLAATLAPIEGAFLENKEYSLAVHFREVNPADHALVDGLVSKQADRHPTLKRTGGKMIHELRPDIEWNKGTAILHIMKALDLTATTALPIYIGDDETDEDGFKAVQNIGIGLKVGADNTPTCAHYRLETPGDVSTFLGLLAENFLS